MNNVFGPIYFLYTDAKTEEFFELKVFNHDFRPTDSEMHALLKKANLTGRGYKKEVTTRKVQNAGDGTQEFQAWAFLYVGYESSAWSANFQINAKYHSQFTKLFHLISCILSLEIDYM